MKFEMKQEKMRDMLEKITMQNLFPISIIKADESGLSSIQREANGVVIREAIFKKSFFESFEVEETEYIELDVQRALSVIKKVDSTKKLSFETKENKVVIKGDKVSINLSLREPNKDDILERMPFEIKEGKPCIKNIKLSSTIKMKLSDLKDTTDYGSSLSTEFYTFKADKDGFEIRVGDLHKFSDFVIFKPEVEFSVEDESEAVYTVGLPQLANTFTEKKFTINYASDAPAYMIEENEHCLLGILFPPQVKPKE